MEKKEIVKLLKQGEGINLEFKPSLSDIDRITDVVCSFANAKGGMVLIGISDAGEIKGVDIGRQTIERLTDTIVDNLDPRIYPEIKLLKVDKKIIILIKVSESPDKPHLARGKAFIRVGKNSKLMSSSEYAKLFQITERMARNDLRRLADAKIIARKGNSKKTTYYVLTEI